MDWEWKPIALVVVGALLIATPVIAPPSDVLMHDTQGTAKYGNTSTAERYTYDIYHYENLSDRAKTIYKKTLRNGGEYTVPLGKGAPEFQYPTQAEMKEHKDNITKALSMTSVVIVRPNESSLPPADEEAGYRKLESLSTFQKKPEIGSGAYVPQLLVLFVGVCLLSLGGYLQFGRSG